MRMIIRQVEDNEKATYNKNVSHVIQSWEWGDFRKAAGLDVVRIGHYVGSKMVKAYQLTFHPIPVLGQTIGYLPKGPMPDRNMVRALLDLGKDKNAAFIKIEPNVVVNWDTTRPVNGNGQKKVTALKKLGLVPAKKSLFTRYNFLVDLTRTSDEIMASFSQKTRYNIGVAQKKGVVVYESTDNKDFEIYLKLYFKTTKRQRYFGHTVDYHKKLWQVLKPAGMARLLIAKFNTEPLVAWMLFNFGDTLYYPYGGSSTEHRELMASNLVCFETIALGKKLKLKYFDMWGALGPEAKDSDPWFGFHRFKAGYGPMHVEYVGTYDLILKPALYNTLNAAEKLRWVFLRITRR